MGFGEAVRTCLRKYVDFHGRARRAEYWWFVLFGFIVGFAAQFLDRLVAPHFVAEYRNGPAYLVTSLVLILPSLAVAVRRLHDIDRTGWWVLGFYTLVGVLTPGCLIAVFTHNLSVLVLLLLLIIVIVVWAIMWLASKGTTGTNRFGPDPLAGDSVASPSPAAAQKSNLVMAGLVPATHDPDVLQEPRLLERPV